MLNNLKLGTRIAGSCEIVSLILTFVVAVGYFKLGRYASASGWDVHTYLGGPHRVTCQLDNVEISK